MNVAPAPPPTSGVRPSSGPVAVRLAMGCFVLALAASLSTCRIDKLTNPATADRLTVDQDSLVASANVGSLVPETTTVRVGSADGVALTWTATKTAAWVTLIPSPDSLVVELHPDTLSQTLHRDTIVFTSPQSVETVRVPIVFTMLPPAAELVVFPTDRDTSAFVGSAQPDTFSLRIKNKGALPLTWTAALNASWVTLSDSGGTVPPQDTTSTIVLVTLKPESLSTGTHRDTITFAAPGAIGAPAMVPVTFTINPCAQPTVTPDIVVTGSITLRDCGARGDSTQAKLYGVQPTAGDTLSFRLSAAFAPLLVLTNNAGDSLDASDACGVDTACITNFPVTVTGRYVIEATTEAARDTGAFTLSVVRERRPNPPQALGQFRKDSTTAIGVGATTPDDTVVFKATINDPNPGDSVRLEIEVVPTGSPFSNEPTDSSAFVAVASGARTVAVRSPSPGRPGLQENAGHHWQARACDKTDRCSAWLGYGNPDPAADFVVNAVQEAPAVPTMLNQFHDGSALPVGGGTGGGGLLGSTETVTFVAVVADPDSGDVVSIEVEVKEVGVGFNETNLYRGGFVASNTTASRSVDFTIPALGAQKDYHWRARACDQTNRCGGWVSFGNNSETATDFHAP